MWTEESYQTIVVPSFWESIEEESTRAVVKDEDVTKMMVTPLLEPMEEPDLEYLRHEGYGHLDGHLNGWDVSWLSKMMTNLGRRGIPPVFLFVYGQTWRMFHEAHFWLSMVLGKDYRVLPDIWGWNVEPSDEATGWPPHRDKMHRTVEDDGTPQSVTVWIPLTPASPLNGCMYVVPMHRDPTVKKDSKAYDKTPVPALQDIRALPALPGDVLMWNQGLVHWGGRSSRFAKTPRQSIAMEFQAARHPPMRKLLMEPLTVPSFEGRLQLIANQILVYADTYPCDPATLELAKMIKERKGR